MTGLNSKIVAMTDGGNRRPMLKAHVERAFRRVQALVDSAALALHGEASGDFTEPPQQLQADCGEFLSASAQCMLQELELALKDSLAGRRPAVAPEFDPLSRQLLGGRHGNP